MPMNQVNEFLAIKTGLTLCAVRKAKMKTNDPTDFCYIALVLASSNHNLSILLSFRLICLEVPSLPLFLCITHCSQACDEWDNMNRDIVFPRAKHAMAFRLCNLGSLNFPDRVLACIESKDLSYHQLGWSATQKYRSEFHYP